MSDEGMNFDEALKDAQALDMLKGIRLQMWKGMMPAGK